jgi:hypothetical protein
MHSGVLVLSLDSASALSSSTMVLNASVKGIIRQRVNEKTARGNHSLGLKVKDLDTACSSSAQPVPVWREYHCVDYITRLQRVKMTTLIEVPKHGDTVFTTGCGERTIGGNGEGVDVPSVTVVVGLELAFGDFPDLRFVRR